MEYKTAKALLEFYPIFYRRVEDQREDILDSYSSTLADTGRRGSGGYSDPTASKGVKLADLGQSSKALGKVIDFMNILTPEQREFILQVWRCSCSTWAFIDWKTVARRMRMRQVTCHLTWRIS